MFFTNSTRQILLKYCVLILIFTSRGVKIDKDIVVSMIDENTIFVVPACNNICRC